MNSRFQKLLAAAALCGGLNRAALAQVAAPTVVSQPLPRLPVAALPQQGVETRVIPIRNVSAKLMAHWLDAAHNVVLEQYEDVKPTWAIGHSDAEIKAMLSPSRDVQAVIGDDAGNAVWVIGTPEGIAQVAEKVALLDTPLRQIEVEAKCIQISAADVKTLGIDFTKQGGVETGIAGADIKNQIAALITQGRAKIITAPRIVAISGHKASLTSLSATPVVFDLKRDKGNLMAMLRQAGLPEDLYILYVNRSIGLTAMPTLNTDGSITLQMGPLRTAGLTVPNPDAKHEISFNGDPRLKDLDGIPTQPLTVKDNQTAVLSGLNWSFWEMNFSNIPQNSTTNVIVLVTARIVRRTKENVQTIALKR